MEPIKFKTSTFRTGSYVYVEDQVDSHEFYIVKQGSLIEENPLKLLTGELDTIIKTGDFFGVLDCMSRRPRVSSIRVLENTILIIVRFDQFESLITQMAPVAMKIIRYFSNQLRKYNFTLTSLTHKNTSLDISSPVYLAKLGEYYQKQGLLNLTGYAYSKFLEYFPTGDINFKIKKQLDILNYDPESNKPYQQGIQQTYSAGTPIFLEHEEGSDLYIILDGFVKITKLVDDKEILLGMLRDKDIFGEMAILEGSLRSASAIASTKVTVLKINKQNFELYIRTHPEIARRIIQVLSDRIWLVYKRLANQLILEPNNKIYDALQTLLQKNRIPLKKGLAYSFEMSPDEIIQFIGLDPVKGKRHIDQLITYDPALSVENNKLYSKDVYNIRGASSPNSRN